MYVNSDDLKEFTDHPIIDYPMEIIRDKRCPIFKRRSFFNTYDDYLTRNIGRSTIKLLDYIEKNTDYNSDMIWENILRVQNMYDIKNILHLNYSLPKNYTVNDKLNENIVPKIGLFFHIYFEDLIEECYYYSSNMPEYVDIYITTDKKEKKDRSLFSS